MKLRTIQAFVFRNLKFREGVVYSLRDEKTGQTILHSPSFLLRDAKFVVQEGGRQRVLRERQKNIHAGVRGILVVNPEEIIRFQQACKNHVGEPVKYNPYKYDRFVTVREERTISSADYVWMGSQRGFPFVEAFLNIKFDENHDAEAWNTALVG